MKKGKRAPGGGRKASGDFSGLTVPFSVRMPLSMREELKKAAQKRTASQKRTWSEGQELLVRLHGTFDRDRDQSRDRALRAFFFLFSELAEVIGTNPQLAPDWRSDPWLFQAFKLAVAKLLDRLQPAGETKLPEWWRFVRESPSVEGLYSNEERQRITESPEAMAEYAVQNVLRSFNNPQRLWAAYKGIKGMEEKLPPDVRPMANRLAEGWSTTFYGMDHARRDLAPKLRRKK